VSRTKKALIAIGLQQFYADRVPPPEVHTPVELPADEHEALESWLSERAGRRVRLHTPKRGEHRGLLDLAARNAAIAYQTHFRRGRTSAFDALEVLRAKLALPVLPRRIDCFDISTFQGKETVASMVVAEDGRMRKSEYRKFKIGSAHADDFAAMHEVVLRRYQRVLEQGGPFPD
jgi:excinuclease ABC subunit C